MRKILAGLFIGATLAVSGGAAGAVAIAQVSDNSCDLCHAARSADSYHDMAIKVADSYHDMVISYRR